VSLSAARRLNAYTYRDGKEKEEKKKREKNERTNYEHNVQERTRSKYSLSTVNIYVERVLRPFAKSRNAQSSTNLSVYVSYLLLLSIFLLTLLMSIILPSYKVIEDKPRDLITLLFRVFYTFSLFKSPTRLYNREMSINAAFSIVQYLYKFKWSSPR